jgi:NADH:ubiquinone oxidoreductase subunit 5 (subunit L)/multisubunit Na+/H+ antiporter MnhA subunit
MLERLVWLAPVLPLMAAAWIGIGYAIGANRGEDGERRTAIAAQLSTGGALLVLLVLGVHALLAGAPGQVAIAPWLESGAYRVRLSFTLDALALSVGTLVALICLLTVRFATTYLHREPGFQRFFVVLLLFATGMLTIVLAGNPVLAFVGWELAGVSSYLLIGYAHDRPVATENATRVFVTNRIGDAGFVLGIFLAFLLVRDLEWPSLLAGAAGLDRLSLGFMLAGFLMAALAKSALVPFAPWIARALEGPTPSSAVFYGSLMVHAGVFLVLRLAPAFEHAPALLGLLGLFGLLTAVYAWLAGLTQTDVKSALIFSTTGQVGLMFLACGLGWFTLAAWHLAAHAAFRAWQFLSSPQLLHRVATPARPAPAWLTGSRRLHTAAVQRFWLDPLADVLLVRPTRGMARDVARFDDEIVQRVAGRPGSEGVIGSLAEWETQRQTGAAGAAPMRGHGAAGRLLVWLSDALAWLEERLVLQAAGAAFKERLRAAAHVLVQIDQLLAQPRYLLLMIMATFVVIL